MTSLEDLYEIARAFDGIPVLSAAPGSPAHRAGIRFGDVLIRMNGQATRDLTGYVDAQDAASGLVPITVIRDGRELELTMDLGALPDVPPEPSEVLEHVAEQRLFAPAARPSPRLC